LYVDLITHKKWFLGELKDIRKVAGYFDIAIFFVDRFIGNGYTPGSRQFIERFRVGLLISKHLVASGFESFWRMRKFTDA